MKSTLTLIDRLCVLCEEHLPIHMECSLLYDDNGTHIFPELSLTLYCRQNNRTTFSLDSGHQIHVSSTHELLPVSDPDPNTELLSSNQSPPQYQEYLYHLQCRSSILCYPLAALFLLKLWRISQVLKNNFL